MKKPGMVVTLAAVVWIGVVAAAQQGPAPRQGRPAAVTPQSDLNAVVKRYCVTCHSDKLKTHGLTLEHFDVAKASENAEVAEAVIRKLQAGFMPRPGMRRPG